MLSPEPTEVEPRAAVVPKIRIHPFSRPVEVFRGRRLPETATPAG